MGQVYEFDGELFTSTGEFLDALAREYVHGDREYATDALENAGFELSDIGVRPAGV